MKQFSLYGYGSESDEQSDMDSSSTIQFRKRTGEPASVRFDNTHAANDDQQSDIDYRENQLNARIAQFEALVRSTKLSLQEKMDDLDAREQQIDEIQADLKTQKTVQDERFRLNKNTLETERLDLIARKAEIEEHLKNREFELNEIAAAKEREITIILEQYRAELDKQLEVHLEEYQRRFSLRCEEQQIECDNKIQEERRLLHQKETEIIREYELLVEKLETQFRGRKEELIHDLKQKQEESDRQFAFRRQELESMFQKRARDADAELADRWDEWKVRLERREQQIAQRETIIRETEEEWARRRNEFEAQLVGYENLRQEKLRQFADQEARLDERQHYLNDLESRVKSHEAELAAWEESVRVLERQNKLDAEKYRRIQEMEADIVQSQMESSRIREGLVRERHQMQKLLESERLRAKETNELAATRLEDERFELSRQNQKVEQMRLSLERSREELGRMHRETLEIRLATEELWLRMAGDTTSDDLNDSLARIREKLSQQHHESSEKLERQKEELKAVRQQMLVQHERLLQRREELTQWASKCEEMLLEKERQLRLKEDEIEHRQSVVDEMLRRCRDERAYYNR